jgi:hypothetical protein
MKKQLRNLLKVFLVVALFVQFLPLTAIAGQVSEGSGKELHASLLSPGPNSSESHPYSLFIPNVKTIGTSTVFGVESYYYGPSVEMNYTVDMGAYWLRRNGALWMDVEPTKGARNWSAMSSMETEFTNAASLGKKINLIIRRTPTWARLVSNSDCGPIKDQELTAFANFVYDLVKRYSVPPYSVLYYEIWNESEAPILYENNVTYGCWGDTSDHYISARRMAQVLKKVYPKVKEANPQAQVLIGGMLLDCDPNHPPSGKNCDASRFLEILFQEGAGPYFDVVSFHSYDYWYGNYTYQNTNWASSSSTTGPVLHAKTNYLRSVLNQYGFPEKKLMATEISLLCYDNCDDPKQDETKSNYVAEVFAASILQGIEASYWYTLYDNWKENGLIRNDHTPYPAYHAFKFASQEMGNSKGGKDLSNGNFFIYEIYTSKGTLWLMWTNDGQTRSYTFDSTPLGAKDVYGNSLSVSKTMQFNASPRYIEFFK